MPPKIVIFNNPDKDPWKGNLSAHNSQFGLSCGSRYLIIGLPNMGKSNWLKNLIANSTNPTFDYIFIKIYKHSKEFEDINYIDINKFSDLPNVEEVNEKYKNKRCLFVIEDTSDILRKDVTFLDEYMSFFCSHYGFCVVICSQDAYRLPVQIRLKMECFIIGCGLDASFLDSKTIPIPREDKKKLKRIIASGKPHSFVKINLAGLDKKYQMDHEPIDLRNY